MQTNRNSIKIIFNHMNPNLIINIANLILFQLGDLDDLNRLPLVFGLLQLALKYLEHTPIIRMVMDSTLLIHVPGYYVQVEEFVRINVVPYII